MRAQDSIREIKGVGEKAAQLFARLGVYQIGDLLELYPREYEIVEPIRPVSQIREGDVVVLQGRPAASPKMRRAGKMQILTMDLKDATGSIPVVWFNMPFLLKSLRVSQHYILRGRITRKNGRLELVQPKILSEQEYRQMLHKLQPVYPLTAGLTNRAVTKAVSQALAAYDWDSDFLPLEIRRKYGLAGHRQAVQGIHFPADKQEYAECRHRLVFEEFFLFSLALNQMRQGKGRKQSRFVLRGFDRCEDLIRRLPFTLTPGQEKVWKQIRMDLGSGLVMNRLIQGDVGSGKTIVAVLALLAAVESGHQGAIMVPTEVLARQHEQTFREYLEPLGVRVGLLTGAMTAAARRKMRQELEEGTVDIVVGTHALIQEGVAFRDLALVVTDEQHRFGVRQREGLSEKGSEPHMLVMSATPIPRTLAIILYGDLDVSVIDVLPSDRLPIKNCVVGTDYRPQAYRFMEREVAGGHQVYIICPMVEQSENMEAENVMDYTGSLRQTLAPSVRVECLHGQMKPAVKTEIMERFAAGEIDILVSTTVIEVGINVPNATVMMIENAERFGLAQLHQLRGRVGRGNAQSYCIFMAGRPSRENMERLSVLGHSNDGFYIANEDLKMRGPGELFGVRQSGELNFGIADIYRDSRVLMEAHEAASAFERSDVLELCKKYASLQKKLEGYTGDIFL